MNPYVEKSIGGKVLYIQSKLEKSYFEPMNKRRFFKTLENSLLNSQISPLSKKKKTD